MEHAEQPQMVAILDYKKLRADIERELWVKLKAEAEKLTVTRQYYSMGEVCEVFGKSSKTIERWNAVGKLCYSTVTEDGSKLFSIQEVNALHEYLKSEREKRYEMMLT
jgi:hypothetical protein